ncbi:class IV adenylate cyclase [Spirochaeta thermophila]|uniref:CYTH domain-containing protein n=1 Tax=Winmispira thermophila (strain ATCC 49972 / DSM 6192 / RI 19.B1) TaxID=665571 RepID=E0RNK3_WINT6|nr:class IV adenylate cyclase [Spirochaeta thermophila]ADN02594.1 hypothetical protein STHERM_c16560 [Spirochaeta thermophila DSM 6192]
MAREIEVKAWVEDPVALRGRLEAAYGGGEAFRKEDEYYTGPPVEGVRPRHVRLRREGERWTCAFKVKRIEAGVERNEEVEFGVEDAAALRALLDYLGCSFLVRKVKQGWRFRGEGVVVELCEVGGLGWFLEVEAVGAVNEEDAVRRVQDELARWGLKDAVEARTYLQLLCGRSEVEG